MTRKEWARSQVLAHWLSVVFVVGLYLLGDYMVGLDYYDPWYHSAPNWHRSIGIMFLLLLLVRFCLRLVIRGPEPVASHANWERLVGSLTHGLLYMLLFVICLSGYLISTANGKGVSVFEWFEVPATLYGFENQEDIAGEIHEWAIYAMLVLAGLHALAALKHHFVDRDETLRRMLRWKSN